MAKTASISMEIDSVIKERAMAVLEARGMSLSGAVRRMVTLEYRIPFEVTRDPVFAGADMSDGLAKRCGIDKEAPARTGVPTGMVVKMEPEFKREMRRYCSDMCVTPNGLVHMFLGAGRLRAARAVRRLRPAPPGAQARATGGDFDPRGRLALTARAPGAPAHRLQAHEM